MRFTEDISRESRKHCGALLLPQKILDLAEVLSARMRLRTDGRLWRGAHIRRGGCTLLFLHPDLLNLSSPCAIDFDFFLKKSYYNNERPRPSDGMQYRGCPVRSGADGISAPERREPLRSDRRTRHGPTMQIRRRRCGLHVELAHDRAQPAAQTLGP